MDLTSLSVFRQMEGKMHWLSARQGVLAENIANADTPGYRSRDLKPFAGSQSFGQHLQLAKALPVAVTNASHIDTSGVKLGPPSVQRDRTAFETSPNGNQVSLEDQLTKVGQTGMDYQMLTNLYRKQVALIKTALGRGGQA